MVNKRSDQVFCSISLAIILFFAISIAIRTITRQVLIKKYGITNAFTKVILFDVQKLKDFDAQDNDVHKDDDVDILEENSIEIDWESLYPFSSSDQKIVQIKSEKEETKSIWLNQYIEIYKEKVKSIKSKIDIYVSDFLIGYHKIVNLSKSYEKLIQWNYTSYSEYNGIFKLKDGYLYNINKKKDVTEVANSIADIAQFCMKEKINLLYVLAPHKICKYEDEEISGTLDFTNQNADSLLDYLRSFKIDFIDLRKDIHEENLSHHNLFYRTDHHWNAEMGLWTSRHILQSIKRKYKYNIDLSVLNKEKIKTILYPAWFLGSQGKKVTLQQTTPDDFSLLYPTYETSLHYIIPSKNIDVIGDFSILYDMQNVNVKDYYMKNPYATFIYADQALEQITNNLIKNNVNILILHDSFGNCVIPFMAMGVKHIDSIDLRFFTGSVKSFIKTKKIDIVILLYGAHAIGGKIDWSNHKDIFDFR